MKQADLDKTLPWPSSRVQEDGGFLEGVLVRDGTVPHEQGSVAYRDFGGAGPTVLLLHGLGGNLAHWGPVASILHARYRLLAIDLPSHGASAAPAAYSFDADVSAVDEVRRHLGLDRPALVGHSYGGMLAVALAAVHPGAYRVVVNIDGMGFALGSEAHPEVHHEQLPVWSDVTAGDAMWLEAEVEREVEEAAEIGLRLDPDGEMVRRAFQLGTDGLWHGSPTTDRFVEIIRAIEALRLMPFYAATSCRTVTVVAEHPRTSDDEAATGLRQHVGRVQAALRAAGHELDSVASGHYAHVEVPGVVADRFERWIGG